MSNGKKVEHHYRIYTSNGKTKWIYEQIVPKINKDGEISHFFGTAYDMTSFLEVKMGQKENARLVEGEPLADDLKVAIKNNELELYYQVQVNPNTEVIVGAEALIRWNHKYLGLVPPEKFLPIAEEAGLIHEIEDWVIETVCKQLKNWQEEGFELYPISINISPIRFSQEGLEEEIQQKLATYGIPSKYIVIEITEYAFLKNEKNVLSSIDSLRKLGVKIALDDFGTGFSSLSYLRYFKADILKIDRSFIRDLYVDCRRNAVITTSLIHLAKGLKMKIVAEGVEEYDQLEFLKQNGCDTVQGFIYSKPVPVKEFEKLMKRRYLQPLKQKGLSGKSDERRKYFRFKFPGYLLGKMQISEVNERKVDIGTARILIENISIGGLKFYSSLKLPINTNIKLNFYFELMGRNFKTEGTLAWMNNENSGVFMYGVSFENIDLIEDELAEFINKMTILKRFNTKIPNTNIIYDKPGAYLRKHLV